MTLTRRLLAVASAALFCAAGLSVVTPPGAQAALGPAVGTVDWNDVHQPIDGFGGSGAFNQAGKLMAYPEPARTQILDLLFSQTSGAGLSMVRNLIPNIEPIPGVYAWDRDADQIWLMQEAALRGTTRYMSTVWSPPPWMKDNSKECCGGAVINTFYPAFADYLAEYVLQYKQRFGIDIYAVSPANEPDASTDYASSRWTGPQLRDFTNWVKLIWAQKNVQAKYMIPESSFWSEEMALASLASPDAAPRVDIVAAHGYARETNPAKFTASEAAGKRVWQTEMSRLGISNDPTIQDGLEWAKRINNFMTKAEVSLFNHWWLITEKPDTREALIDLHTATNTYTVNKRLWTLGNWARFVRPGWERIGASATDLSLSAFRDPASGQFAVVAINDTTSARSVNLRLNGFSASSVTPYTTSATLNLAAGAPVSTTSGFLNTTLPARSVVTFVGTGTQTSPLAVTVNDAKVFSGESVATPVSIKNTGATPVSGTLTTSVGGGMAASPSSASFGPVAPGATATIPVVLTAPATSTAVPGAYTLEAAASLTSSPVSVVGMATARLYTTQVLFVPNTSGEAPWLHADDASQLNGAVEDGNARFMDASTTVTYKLEVPADATGGSINLDVGNQFLVSTSTDGVNFTTRLSEAAPVRDLSNRAYRSIDLNTARAGGSVVYVRLGDSQPADGWGAWLAHVRLDLARP